MSLGEAILRAMEDCKRSDVLKVFLKEHEREVYNMILGEWSMDEALEVRAEEAEARGIAIGEARGMSAVLDLVAQGYGYEQIKDILNRNS
ncbi:MAG: hypothetical protein FWC26_00840, partial [Fibromonadales bacterium]|nr:hypothetical protein [Fibromonadales bacterium]